jgi:hypothetical protein
MPLPLQRQFDTTLVCKKVLGFIHSNCKSEKKCPTTAVMVEAFFKASFFQTEPKHLKPKSSVTKHARVEA